MKFLLSALASLVGFASAADYAVIVAGSQGYGNYRHQADACHAYQIVSKWGIPEDNIIMMFMDDIASSSENPFPGQMFNKPTAAGTPGVDVYGGCKKVYTGADVTPDNFLGVLTGDSTKTGGKPVLTSTKSDRVFINFVDHGGTGILAFPSSYLRVGPLNTALKTGFQKGLWGKLVFYVEACESGSMFDGVLDPSISVYVTTASNPTESSWGTYCPPDDMVNGKSINSCLGDLYSVNWMQNAESVGQSETLADQYTAVKAATSKSHVMQYGDQSYTSDPIGDFMGGGSALPEDNENKESVNVSSRDIPLHLAYYNYLRADAKDVMTRQILAANLQQEISHRMEVDSLFMRLTEKAAADEDAAGLFTAPAATPYTCGTCCDTLLDTFEAECGRLDDYSLQYVRVIANVCGHIEEKPETVVALGEAIKGMCM